MIDELRYRSYKFNRAAFPEISAERWAQIFTDAAEMEQRYKNETHSCSVCSRRGNCRDEMNMGYDCNSFKPAAKMLNAMEVKI